MAGSVERRLQALERQQAARPALGLRCFEQSSEQPEVFYEGEARRAYTRAEISALAEQGWQCILICWESAEPGAIHLAWGDA